MPKFQRQAILAKFREMIARREPIIGGGAVRGYQPNVKSRGN